MNISASSPERRVKSYAREKFHDLNDANRRRTVSLPEKFKKKYDDKVDEINDRASRADIHTSLIANGIIEIGRG